MHVNIIQGWLQLLECSGGICLMMAVKLCEDIIKCICNSLTGFIHIGFVVYYSDGGFGIIN